MVHPLLREVLREVPEAVVEDLVGGVGVAVVGGEKDKFMGHKNICIYLQLCITLY